MRMTNAEIVMICLTTVLAVVGVIGACIFNGQLSVMQGQLNEMKSASADTKQAAAAAMKSANVASDTLIHTQRAFLHVSAWPEKETQ